MMDSTHCDPANASAQAVHADWLRPDWPAPAHVHALCTTRAGGCSTGAYASMNLGAHVGDAQQAVATNRGHLAAALQTISSGARPVLLDQVHGSHAVQLGREMPDGTVADAAWASAPGLACTIMVADCLPVLFTDRQGRRVAAAHAGWRGLAGGVLEVVVERFGALAHVVPADAAIKLEAMRASELLAWLGPCIGPKAFEVGEDVRTAFCAADSSAEQHFVSQGVGKFLANLPALARQRLIAQGIQQVYGNDGSDAWCTFSQPSRFYSHRRDGAVGGGTGRMAACIWLG